MRKLCLVIGLLSVVLSLGWQVPPAAAQIGQLGDFSIGGAGAADAAPNVTVSAAFSGDAKTRRGELSITAEIADTWHIYSITQAPGGPVRSKITLDESTDFKVTGDFKPSSPPDTRVDSVAYPGLKLEEHEKTVTWTAPIEFAADVDPAGLKISGKLLAQACNEKNCDLPQKFPFTAAFAPAATPPASETPARTVSTATASDAAGEANDDLTDVGVYEASNITFRGSVSPRMIVPGGKFKLTIEAEPAPDWHVYALGEKPATSGPKPTLLVLTSKAGLKQGLPVASETAVFDPGSSARVHHRPVAWTVELTAPSGTKRGPLTVEGLLAYQICTHENCLSPTALGFTGKVAIGAQTVDGRVALHFDSKHRYKDVEDLFKDSAASSGDAGRAPPTRGGKTSSFDPNQLKPADVKGQTNSLAKMVAFGFLGGFILNLMPCVLPVIGLKILSFLEQSGHSRRQAFLLNLWYSLGMLAVFMALATLPVVSRLWFNQDFGWGQQFSYVGFNITLAALVFAMALSFLGVWEIPIPGFVGGSAASQLASKEGFSGAFAKGAITTVLATPCSGPFLGTALGFALAQPPLVIYLMFFSIGLGMASPYLLIGAYPQLLRFLPKPGAWMDTVKQVMGFVLLGTVVYLMTLVSTRYFIPTLTLLFGLWAGCWWIGRTPLYAELSAKLRAWGIGSTIAAAVGLFAFMWLGAPTSHKLPWQPFSVEELTRLTSEGKTVMLDFTADWCPTCKILERTVLNTEETKAFVERNGIVPMVADITSNPEEETALLAKLKAKFIPVLAIFPAGRPNEPIVLRDAYTQGTLFEKLTEAGPSQNSGQVAKLSAR
ncbi:MAG TPA: thioredoxin family protein [Pirellulales bacterium]|nr:thioredoxin family protein [Pirellulales bacterium]